MGRYMCQINTVTAKTQYGFVKVVGKWRRVTLSLSLSVCVCVCLCLHSLSAHLTLKYLFWRARLELHREELTERT